MLEFGVLGPLGVSRDGVPLDLAGQRRRSLLALLLLGANRVIATESLVDALWGEQPPRTATTSLQNGISQLRKLLGAEVVETRPPGYVLHAAPEQLDLARFERLVQRARGEEPAERVRTLREALDLWRGEPLADLTFETFAQDEIRRLQELRLVALEERLEAEMDMGRHTEAIAELEGLVARHPLRERLFHTGPERVNTRGNDELRGVPVTQPVQIGASTGRRVVKIRIGDWPSGLYFARLTASDGRVGFAPFIVRPHRLGEHRVAVVLPTMTWQAYNLRDDDGDGKGDSWYARWKTHTAGLGRPFLNRGVPYNFRRYDLPFRRHTSTTSSSATATLAGT